jgi:hypothetical protein
MLYLLWLAISLIFFTKEKALFHIHNIIGEFLTLMTFLYILLQFFYTMVILIGNKDDVKRKVTNTTLKMV